jgi:hypothetical protein
LWGLAEREGDVGTCNPQNAGGRKQIIKREA